jgi:hypothetical protein
VTNAELRRVLVAALRARPLGLRIDDEAEGLLRVLVALRERSATVAEIAQRAPQIAGWVAAADPSPPAPSTPAPPTLPTGRPAPKLPNHEED